MASKPKRALVDAAKKYEALNQASNLTVDKVTETLAKAQSQLQKTLSEVGQHLVEEVSLLENADLALLAKNEELKRLYSIEVAATTLDDLQNSISSTREQWQLEVEKKEAFLRDEEEQLKVKRERKLS